MDETPANTSANPGPAPGDPFDPEAGAAPRRRIATSSELAQQAEQSERMLKVILRLVFIVLLVTVSVLTYASIGRPDEFGFSTIAIAVTTLFGVGLIVIVIDYLTPRKRIAPMIGVYIGIMLALVGALAVAKLLDVIAESWELEAGDARVFIELAKVVIGIILCYLAVSFVLTTKDDFRLVIPYVEFSKQVRGIRPMLLDTSVLIDGRIEGMVQAGFVDAPLVVPRFVLEELQTLSDSQDKLKRARGRRGLDMVSKLQANPALDLSIDHAEVPGRSVDRMLVEYAHGEQMRILTTDYNLGKIGRIHGVTVLNINDLANNLKPAVIPGEALVVEIVKRGENEGQGVGYLPDGTMVVVEDAAEHIGRTIETTVTNSLQTSAGRLIFGRVAHVEPSDDDDSVRLAAERVGESATHQPRHTDSGRDRGQPPRRNPRR